MKLSRKCKTCHKEFKPFNSLQKFCSYKCANTVSCVYQSNVMKVPVKQVYRSKNYISCPELDKSKKIIKAQMLKDRGHKYCQKCNASSALFWNYHHIIFRSEKPCHPKLHDVVNLIHVCSDCHDWFHEMKNRRMYLVKERGLNEIFGQDVLKTV